jgi:hypothetical protein
VENLYDLPFEGISGIREAYSKAKQQEEKYYFAAFDTLKEELSSVFGYSLPIKLGRHKNKSYAPITWRDSSNWNRVRNLESAEVKVLLATLSLEKHRKLLDIELKRIHLNHAIGLVQYEMTRLKRLEAEFTVWRGLMREVNQRGIA